MTCAEMRPKPSSTRCIRFALCSLLLGHSLTTPVLPAPSFFFHLQALDLPNLLKYIREKCLALLCRLCGQCTLLPTSLQIPISYNRLGDPLYRGGFADVWKEEHLGRHVAVRVLRVYSPSDTGKIASVSLQLVAKMVFADRLTLSPCRGSARRF